MDQLQTYVNYSSEDFVEDSFFWEWVLGEDEKRDNLWKEFMQTYPHKKEAIEKAKEKVLHLNAGKYRLSSEKVTSLWAKIQETKSGSDPLALTTNNSGLAGSVPLTHQNPRI